MSFSYTAILVQPLTRFYSIRIIIIITGLLSTVGLAVCAVAPCTSVIVFGLFFAGKLTHIQRKNLNNLMLLPVRLTTCSIAPSISVLGYELFFAGKLTHQ